MGVRVGGWGVRVGAFAYLQQMVTPSAPHPPAHPAAVSTTQFNFGFKAEDERSSLDIRFARRTEVMPQPPQVCAWCVAACRHAVHAMRVGGVGGRAWLPSLSCPDLAAWHCAFPARCAGHQAPPVKRGP